MCEWCWFIAFNTRQSHQSCLVPWPTGCKWHRQFHQSCLSLIPLPAGSEWHCFICLPGSLINHISSTANRMWVILLYLFARLSHELACLIPWPTASEWHCFICLCSLINHVSSHEACEWKCIDFSLENITWYNHMMTHNKCVIQLLVIGLHYILHCMSNRKWVEFDFICKAVHQISSHDQ